MPKIFGTKWGESKDLGAPGGVVTWSVVAAGTPGVSVFSETTGSNLAADPFSRTTIDVIAAIRSSFAEWSAAADIEFLQVKDGGGRIGVGTNADIRIAFGQIDGAAGRVAAKAFFPPFGTDPVAVAGDILFDIDEFGAANPAFFSNAQNFRNVALHEIGHSIGLGHPDRGGTVMTPDGRTGTLTDDDVEGALGIYGPQDGARPVLRMSADRDFVDILEETDGLLVLGHEGADRIRGGAGGETVRAGGGDDTVAGRAGNDTLLGGSGDDVLVGAAGRDKLRGQAGDDRLRGGGDNDRLVGQGGADRLLGGGGDDILQPGAGADTLKGGGGADRFVFRAAVGDNVVKDFRVGVDELKFVRADSLADLSLTDGGRGALIALGGLSVRLNGVDVADLTPGDFIF